MAALIGDAEGSWVMDWLDSVYEGVYDYVFSGSDGDNFLDNVLGLITDNPEESASILGAVLGLTGAFDSDQKRLGYQGKIPEYTAVREQVPSIEESAALADLPPRRPGSTPVRYFSDVTYAGSGDGLPSLAEAQSAASQQAGELDIQNLANLYASQNGQRHSYASGGIVDAMNTMREGASGRYLRGGTDGMGDRVPGSVGGSQAANLSHGEYVVPADVVSHLGNGNSEAGAMSLDQMMQRIRMARTGQPSQAPQINPNKMMPR